MLEPILTYRSIRPSSKATALAGSQWNYQAECLLIVLCMPAACTVHKQATEMVPTQQAALTLRDHVQGHSSKRHKCTLASDVSPHSLCIRGAQYGLCPSSFRNRSASFKLWSQGRANRPTTRLCAENSTVRRHAGVDNSVLPRKSSLLCLDPALSHTDSDISGAHTTTFSHTKPGLLAIIHGRLRLKERQMAKPVKADGARGESACMHRVASSCLRLRHPINAAVPDHQLPADCHDPMTSI
jgi:hypothetical protein